MSQKIYEGSSELPSNIAKINGNDHVTNAWSSYIINSRRAKLHFDQNIYNSIYGPRTYIGSHDVVDSVILSDYYLKNEGFAKVMSILSYKLYNNIHKIDNIVELPPLSQTEFNNIIKETDPCELYAKIIIIAKFIGYNEKIDMPPKCNKPISYNKINDNKCFKKIEKMTSGYLYYIESYRTYLADVISNIIKIIK